MVDVDVLIRHVDLTLGQAVGVTLDIATAFHPDATRKELGDLKMQNMMVDRVRKDGARLEKEAENIAENQNDGAAKEESLSPGDTDTTGSGGVVLLESCQGSTEGPSENSTICLSP